MGAVRSDNPVHHGDSEAAIATYKVEPYVVAADVYTNPSMKARGGWTWYTGSAGWMYRLITESLLGLRLEVDKLHVSPLIPSQWGVRSALSSPPDDLSFTSATGRGRGARFSAGGL